MTPMREALMVSIHSAKAPSGGREIPVPRRASTITCAPLSRSSLEISTPSPRSTSSSCAAASRRRRGSMQLTTASRPQRWSWRAAASPSPALLPTPHTTAVAPLQKRATCQPAASISQSTGTPKRVEVRVSTSLTWWLVRVGSGRALDDKRAVGVVAVDGIGLRDSGVQETSQELGGDGANLRKLERGVAERAVVDGDLDAFWRFGLLGQGPGAPDPGHDAPELLIEVEALEFGLDCRRVALGDPREDLVQRFRSAHLLHLLQDHRGQLAVPLREDCV